LDLNQLPRQPGIAGHGVGSFPAPPARGFSHRNVVNRRAFAGAMRKTLTIHAIILACPVANALMRPQPLTKTKSNQIN